MRILILPTLSLLLLSTSADAWVLCAKLDKRTDSYREGTSVKIRNICRKSEVVVDPADLGMVVPEGPRGPKGDAGEKGDTGDQGDPGTDGSDLSECVVRTAERPQPWPPGWNGLWDIQCEPGETVVSGGVVDPCGPSAASLWEDRPLVDLSGWRASTNCSSVATGYAVCCPAQGED